MDAEADQLSFISWSFFPEPVKEEAGLCLPYFVEDLLPPFIDSWRDSYDLLPLPECLEHNAVPLACLPPPTHHLCSDEAIDYYTYSSSWENQLISSCSQQAEYMTVYSPTPVTTLPVSQASITDGSVMEQDAKRLSGRKVAEKRPARSSELGLEEIKAYFDKPITRAAMEMNVGLTVLKKRCRDLGITRWPHRKMKSLNTLIHNIQELGQGTSDMNIEKELKSLQAHRKLMEENPEMQLTEKTKKLRQACFKANYKKRITMQAHSPYLHPLQSLSFR